MKFAPKLIGTACQIYLDLENLKIEGRENMENYLTFACGTYKKISNDGYDDPEVWDSVFGCQNWYLKVCSDDDKVKLAKFFCNANYAIKHEMPKDEGVLKINQFIEKLGGQFAMLVNELNLIPKFDAYSHQFIIMGDTSQFGKRPQDTAELTFTEPEMRELIVVALLCKLLTPVFGELMTNMPPVIGEDGKKKTERDREMRCVVLVNETIKEHFAVLMTKFQYYLQHTVRGCCSVDKPAAIFSGYTESTRSYIIFSNLLVRNFINVNLRQEDSNIMRFSDSIARTLVNTQDSTANRKQVKTRVAYGASATGDEGGNIAQMEIDSLVSNRTMDVPIIVAASVDKIVSKWLMKCEISKKEFNSCLNFFKEHPIFPTQINRFTACGFFGPDLGGGRGVLLLDSTNYTKLICLLQMIVFSYGYKDLGHILTASPTTTVKVVPTQSDNLFLLNYGNSYSYRNCKAKFDGSTLSSSGREWDQQMKDIVDDLTKNFYVYNTPEFIWDTMQEDDENGKVIVIESQITGELCLFIENSLCSEF